MTHHGRVIAELDVVGAVPCSTVVSQHCQQGAEGTLMLSVVVLKMLFLIQID